MEEAARRAVADGAPSVDLVGYSAGGVVARWFVAELGGAVITRRVVSLASPHHGTDRLPVVAPEGGQACPTVVAITLAQLGVRPPTVPTSRLCAA